MTQLPGLAVHIFLVEWDPLPFWYGFIPMDLPMWLSYLKVLPGILTDANK